MEIISVALNYIEQLTWVCLTVLKTTQQRTNINNSQIFTNKWNSVLLGMDWFYCVEQASSFLKAQSICLRGWHSLHMKSAFNAPAAAAAGNGWYMLYNHRGRENPHSSAVPSRENTDRKHSNHFKLQDLSGLPAAGQNSQNRQTDSQSVSRTSSHTSVLCAALWSLTVTMDIPAPHITYRERKGEEKHSHKFPQSVFSCEDLLEFISISNHSQHLLERGRAKSVCQQTVSSQIHMCFSPIIYTLFFCDPHCSEDIMQTHQWPCYATSCLRDKGHWGLIW